MSQPPIVYKTIDGQHTATCVVGTGRPVIALHGWKQTIESFWPVAAQLSARGYQVHILDLPGFGRSDLPPVPWGVSDYVHFVLAYLDSAGLAQVAILGHSFGGRIALMLAAEHPERVSKMVLAASAGLRTPPRLAQRIRGQMARLVSRTLERAGLISWRDSLRKWFNRQFASQDYLTAGPLRETMVRVIEEDLSPWAPRIQAPTVLIWGDQDTETPLWQGKRLEQLIPDAGLILFAGAGHFAYMERLGDYIRIVDHFLNSGS